MTLGDTLRACVYRSLRRAKRRVFCWRESLARPRSDVDAERFGVLPDPTKGLSEVASAHILARGRVVGRELRLNAAFRPYSTRQRLSTRCHSRWSLFATG